MSTKAQTILDKLQLHTPPVNVMYIASQYGFRVQAVTSPQWDAALDRESRIIYTDAAGSLTRQRFSAAHMLGHWFNDESRTHRCKFSSCGWGCLGANWFAMELLCPWHWVKAYQLYGRETVVELAVRFGVSEDLMKVVVDRL